VIARIPAWLNSQSAQARASGLRDLDETRRLASAILHARRSRSAVLIPTLAGALACQGLAADPGLAAEHVASVVNAPGLAL
jgi:hypothetical protein